MKALAPIGLAASGAALSLAIVWLVGIAAAVAIPSGYVDWFSRDKRLAFLLADLALIVAPVVVLAAGWTLVTLSQHRPRRAALPWFVLGAVSVYLYYAISSSLVLLSFHGAPGVAVWIGFLLKSMFPADVWSLPKLLAPWVGIWTGYVLAVRRAGSP